MHGDDSVGLLVAGKLRDLLATRPVDGVVVRLVERAGFDLIDVLADADNIVIVDCLDLPSPTPGRVRVLAPADAKDSARLPGEHDIGLGVALDLGRLLGIRMPETVAVVGIEGGDTTVSGEDLTPAVARTAANVAAWLHMGLRLGLRHTLATYVERQWASASALP